MTRRNLPSALAALSLLLVPLTAQEAGARGGVALPARAFGTGGPDVKAAERFITVTARAEVRAEADALRVVLAVVHEAVEVAACERECQAKLDAFLAALAEAGFAGEAVHTDLIAMLPAYEWRYREQDGKRAGYETVRAWRMQFNVHVQAATEADARSVERLAFQKGIPDVIAVDYGCRDLARHRHRAQEAALAEAKRKADLLLALFDERPELINVHEETEVVEPRAQYRSFENVHAQEARLAWEERVPHFQAARPKNTYYEGLFADLDVRDPALPMRPQFSVVSTVKLYFASPARAKQVTEKERDK